MNRHAFKTIYSKARKSKRAAEIQHNGRRWTVTRGDCQRLDSHGCYDRVGALALCLNHAAYSRRRLGLNAAARGLVSLAKDLRK